MTFFSPPDGETMNIYSVKIGFFFYPPTVRQIMNFYSVKKNNFYIEKNHTLPDLGPRKKYPFKIDK